MNDVRTRTREARYQVYLNGTAEAAKRAAQARCDCDRYAYFGVGNNKDKGTDFQLSDVSKPPTIKQ